MPQNTMSADERHALNLTIPALLHERIRAYRAAMQLETEEQAVRDLIERGLEAHAAGFSTIKVGLGLREDRE